MHIMNGQIRDIGFTAANCYSIIIFTVTVFLWCVQYVSCVYFCAFLPPDLNFLCPFYTLFAFVYFI